MPLWPSNSQRQNDKMLNLRIYPETFQSLVGALSAQLRHRPLAQWECSIKTFCKSTFFQTTGTTTGVEQTWKSSLFVPGVQQNESAFFQVSLLFLFDPMYQQDENKHSWKWINLQKGFKSEKTDIQTVFQRRWLHSDSLQCFKSQEIRKKSKQKQEIFFQTA